MVDKKLPATDLSGFLRAVKQPYLTLI